MMLKSATLICSVILAVVSATLAEDSLSYSKTAPWIADWQEPPTSDRPLQIVHAIRPEYASLQGMQRYKNLGLGGIVCNVDFDRYLESDEHWKTLIDGIDACEKLGLNVWLYDEKGYPSGGAGGLVLGVNRTFEATALAFDGSRQDPFLIRPSYEYTHASNNFCYARRYVNILNDGAVGCFIKKTHEAYFQRLKKYFGHTIQAVFTDEPSLMAVRLGALSKEQSKKVPVVDAVDLHSVSLPSVPWGRDLVEQYRQRYGQNLMAQRSSLFAGDDADDRRVRQQFWSLLADLVTDRYFGQIQRWCGDHGIASSGHSLWEERPLHHVPLYGNSLKALGKMDIPGMDELSSDPEVVTWDGWMAAALPLSAALLHGRRRVMTEISDFCQQWRGQGSAPLDAMQATAAWQAAWGVTEFNLYYRPESRSESEYQAYCRYVGRLNAVLKKARPVPAVLLYYPIYDLWAEYRPVAVELQLGTQSALARRIVGSFMALGGSLQCGQVPFVLVDHEMLATASIESPAKLTIGDRNYATLVVPSGVEFSSPAKNVVERFRRAGGQVLVDQPAVSIAGPRLIDSVKPRYRLSPSCEAITLGHFVRDGATIILVVNVGHKEYKGRLQTKEQGLWWHMDPVNGKIEQLAADAAGGLPLTLASHTACFFVKTP